MLVLGIESTCDETSCALVRDGKEILAHCISSQTELHAAFGGVVPELASRRHVDIFPQILRKTLVQANLTMDQIDLIAVARGPGLIGALLVGLHFAKGLSLASDIPLIGVNHVAAHLFAPFMDQEIQLPAIGCVISGGHTALVKISHVGAYELIGTTQDDAIGEAFDKVASLLELPYPGGPEIEKLAKLGNPLKYSLKPGNVKGRPYDFSFSGLKTGVLYLVKGQNASKNAPLNISEQTKCDVAASFQHAAFSAILDKTLLAAKEFGCQSIVIGGGVSNSRTLRGLFATRTSLPVYWPGVDLSCDNAAMIAAYGYHEYLRRGADTLAIEPLAKIPF